MPRAASRPARDLFPHQLEATDQAIKVLASSPRATVVLPCGTGKTLVGAEVAHRIAAAGRSRRLVIVPTLELVHQTMREWVDHLGRPELGRIIAVCSDKEILSARRGHQQERTTDTAVTCDPARLAQLVTTTGPTTIACTYASLGVLAEAQARHGLPAPDIAVVDEAHRTAGPAAKAWAAIHHDEIITAGTRLYLTATPRILDDDRDDMISMSDETVFGPLAYRMSFATAIELDLLAAYRLVVPVVTGTQVQALTNQADSYLKIGNTGVAASMLATQLALLRAAHEHGIRRMITFHRSVQDAKWFSTLLPHAYTLLTPGERPDGLWTDFVHGDQPSGERRRALDRLAGDSQGLGVLSCARVLTEGVDIPAVDAVCFFGTRGTIDTIQCSGRALRRGDPSVPKTASLIVPVVLDPGQDPETALSSSSFAPVWQTVRALASHDDRLATQLEAARRDLAEHRPRTGQASTLPDWLSITGIPVPEAFARAVSARTVRMTTRSWTEYHRAAELFHAEEGHLCIPRDHITPTGLKLGNWTFLLRHRYNQGTLQPDQIQQMNDLDMIWSLHKYQLALLIQDLREFKRQHGHLRVPSSYTSTRADGTAFQLGATCKTLRSAYKKGEVHEHKIQALNAEGFIWTYENQQELWDQFISDLIHFKESSGHLAVPHDYVANGRSVGSKAKNIRSGSHALTEKQREQLDALEFVWDSRRHRLALHLQALKEFKEEYGQAYVKRGYVTSPPSNIQLGKWFHSCLTHYRNGRLSPELAQQLRDLGVDLDYRRGTK